MRIAMIGHKRIPSREGGIEIVVEELSTRMAALGHVVTVYNRAGHHVSGRENDVPERTMKEHRGVRMIWIPTFQRKSLNAIVYAILSTIHALFGKYDVLHYHAEGSCAMIWIPKLFGIRVVATIHGLDWQRAKWGGFATRFLLFGEKMAVKYADEIIVLSENVQDYFKERYQRVTHFIPNGIKVPIKKNPELITEKYNLAGNDYILFLARIVPEKGLHYLIEAYLQAGVAVKLVIVGGSSHTDTYMQEIKTRVEGNPDIILTGFIQGRELEELYSNCLFYVLPSDIEGMPLSLLEALSYGRQCLVSDIRENVEVIGEYGTCFQKGNVEDLKNRLVWLCNVATTRYSAEEIRDYVCSKYDWEQVTNDTIALYKEQV